MEVAEIESIVADAVGKETAALHEEVKLMKSEQKKLGEVVENPKKENKKLMEQLTLLLDEMRKRKEIASYYTKNGNIMARDDTDKRYSLIQP